MSQYRRLYRPHEVRQIRPFKKEKKYRGAGRPLKKRIIDQFNLKAFRTDIGTVCCFCQTEPVNILKHSACRLCRSASDPIFQYLLEHEVQIIDKNGHTLKPFPRQKRRLRHSEPILIKNKRQKIIEISESEDEESESESESESDNDSEY